MDEPTVGIDRQNRRRILDLVKELNAESTSVLYTTHSMEEAQELSHHVGLIDHGKQIALGTQQRLTTLVCEIETLRLNARKEQQYVKQPMRRTQLLLTESPVFTLEFVRSKVTNESLHGMVRFNQSSAGQLITWSRIIHVGGSVFLPVTMKAAPASGNSQPHPQRYLLYREDRSASIYGADSHGHPCVFGVYVLNVKGGNDQLLLILILTVFSFARTTLGFMLGAFAMTAKQADNITPVVSILMAALGGAWWPLEVTRPEYQTVVRALPSTCAMLGFNGIIQKEQGFMDVLPEMLVILSFTIWFSMVGIWRLGRTD